MIRRRRRLVASRSLIPRFTKHDKYIQGRDTCFLIFAAAAAAAAVAVKSYEEWRTYNRMISFNTKKAIVPLFPRSNLYKKEKQVFICTWKLFLRSLFFMY
jgi:hypothetical protein